MPAELSNLLEKIANKYPDDEDVKMANQMIADEEYMDEEPMEDEMDIEMEVGPEGDEAPMDFDMLIEEDMEEPMDEEDEDELMPPKKKK